jgi:hypothetical protein
MCVLEILGGIGQRKTNPITNGMRAFCLWRKRLPRAFGPRNDIRISAPLCLSDYELI